MELFWAKSYDGTTLNDLTKALGINSPSLYAAFGSKEQLFQEAVKLYSTTENKKISDALAKASTAHTAIERFLYASAEAFTQTGRPRGCLIVLGGLHASDAAVAGELQRYRTETAEAIRERLERAVREGELPTHLDYRAVAIFYATVQQGMSIQARDGASRKTLRAVAGYAMATWDAWIVEKE